MFVSSYSTYIQPDISSKESRQRLEKTNSNPSTFSDKLNKEAASASFKSSGVPIDYISRSQAHSNKQELEFQKEQLKNPDNQALKDAKDTMNKFASHNSLSSAKNAYENTNKVFSVFSKQATTLDQTPKMDRNLPQEAQEAKELTMRHQMVNTYISNDNYYRITA